MTVTIRTIDGHTFQVSGEQANAFMLMLKIGKSDVFKVIQGTLIHWIFRANISSVTVAGDKWNEAGRNERRNL